MPASTTRRITQPNSHHSAYIKAASLNKKLGRGATITASALRHSLERNIAQQYYRLRSSTRASTAARLHSRPKSESPVGAQTAPIAQPHPRNDAARNLAPTSRSASTKEPVAARLLPLAQLRPRKHCRETAFAAKIRKPGRSPDRTARAVLRATRLRHLATFALGDLACRRGKLIYGSAIKTSHKRRRISKLQNSNRR